MRSRLFFFILLYGSCFPTHAFSSCGSANCPLNTFRTMGGGWLSLELSHEYINQGRIYVGSSLSSVGAIPGHHDEVHTLNSIDRISINAGCTDRLSFQFNLPFIHREHSHIGHENGTDAWEQWNFSGLGDIGLTLSYAVAQSSSGSAPTITFTGGAKFATGITDAKNADGEEAEVTIQPGTGSIDAIAGVQFSQNIATIPGIQGKYSTLPFTAGITCRFPEAGTNNYRFGNSVLVHAGIAYQLLDKASFLLQMNGRIQDYADVGSTGEPRENTGGVWIYASPGLNFNLSDALDATGYIQLPIYQNVHGIQQTAAFNLYFSLAYHFNLIDTE
jgi:hypothetical protein